MAGGFMVELWTQLTSMVNGCCVQDRTLTMTARPSNGMWLPLCTWKVCLKKFIDFGIIFVLVRIDMFHHFLLPGNKIFRMWLIYSPVQVHLWDITGDLVWNITCFETQQIFFFSQLQHSISSKQILNFTYSTAMF